MKPLAIIAAGATTPIGLTAMETGFGLRAGAAMMREAPILDPAGKPITMCTLPTLAPTLVGQHRSLVLAARALADCVIDLGPISRQLRTRIVLSVAEAADRNLAAQWNAWIDNELTAYVKPQFFAIELDVLPLGKTGALRILPALEAELDQGVIDVAILGGAHTDYDPARIAELSRAGRLFSPENLDSLIPGEAAAFVALVRPEACRPLGKQKRGRITAMGGAQSNIRPDNDAPAFDAQGLTAALSAAMTPFAQGEAIGWTLTDLSFETFRHYELHTAMGRLSRYFQESQRLDHPAQRIGELGPAAIPLSLALASEAARRGYAPHSRFLAIAGSDSGERIVLRGDL